MPRIATTTIGHFRTRSAFNTKGHGVVSTSSADSVAAVSARAIRNAALRTPCGTSTIAGSAIAPVNSSTGIHTHAASLPNPNSRKQSQHQRQREHPADRRQADEKQPPPRPTPSSPQPSLLDPPAAAPHAASAECSASAAYSAARSKLLSVRSIKPRRRHSRQTPAITTIPNSAETTYPTAPFCQKRRSVFRERRAPHMRQTLHPRRRLRKFLDRPLAPSRPRRQNPQRRQNRQHRQRNPQRLGRQRPPRSLARNSPGSKRCRYATTPPDQHHLRQPRHSKMPRHHRRNRDPQWIRSIQRRARRHRDRAAAATPAQSP